MKYIKIFEDFDEYHTKKLQLEIELTKYDIENYTINSDGTIDGDVMLHCKNLKKLPLKFGRVTGLFWCNANELTSLEGSPYYVGEDFICSENKLVNLIGSPIEVGGDFDCNDNKMLTSLEGLSPEIGRDLICTKCSIDSLDTVSNIEGIIFCSSDVDITKFRGYCEEIIIKK